MSELRLLFFWLQSEASFWPRVKFSNVSNEYIPFYIPLNLHNKSDNPPPPEEDGVKVIVVKNF
jgi:hypothetical protein